MKIFHIVTQMEAGGAQGAAVRLHKKMISEGYDSNLIFLYKKRDVYSAVDNTYSLLEKPPKGLLDLIYIFLRLFKILWTAKNPLVMCYTHYANIIGAVVGKFAGSQKIIISHRSKLDCYPRLAILLDKFLGICGFYDKMICVSKTVYDEFGDYPDVYRSKLLVIPNGIAPPSFDKTGKYGWVSDSKFLNLVTAGRLHEQKNHSVLFEAIRNNVNLRLIIAGEGHLRHEYEGYIHANNLEDRLILIGEIPPTEVNEFISEGDIFVFPSATEAFGFSLIEAMAIGIPVVVSDIQAMKEIGEDFIIRLDPNSPYEWSLFFNKNFTENDLDSMSRNSISRASIYTFDKMYRSYLEVFKSVR